YVAAVAAVTGRLGQPQRLDVVALRQPRLPGVDGHIAAELRQPGDGGEQFAPDGLAVRAGEQPGDDAVEVVHHDRPHMPGPEAVVEFAERRGRGPYGLDVRRADPGAGVARDLGVRPGDQPVAARLHQGGGRHRGAAEEVAPPDVAAPQLADLLDRPEDGRGELEP